MQAVLERPRFRADLVAQPIEDEGVRYVDVTDPQSGSTFRFYDVEYSIACAMDGARNVSHLAEWTRSELGIETSPDELETVIRTLADLGYLEGAAADSEKTPPRQTPAAAVPKDAVPSPIGDDAWEGAPTSVHAEPLKGETAEPAPPPEHAKPAKKDESSFAGLFEDKPKADTKEEAKVAAPRKPTPGKGASTGDEEGPTNIPGAVVDDDDDEDVGEDADDVTTEITAAPGDEDLVTPAPPPTPSVLSEVTATGVPEPEPMAIAASQPGGPPPPPPPRTTKPTPAPPERPVAAVGKNPPRSAPVAPIAAGAAAKPRPGTARPSSSLVWLVITFLVVAVAAIGFVFRDRIFGGGESEEETPVVPKPTPGKPPAPVPGQQPVHVVTPTPAPPTPAPTPPPAPLPSAKIAELTQAPKQLKAPAAGTVGWNVEDGAQVAADAPVVKMVGYLKQEAKLQDAIERRAFYEKKLADAQARNDAAGADVAQKKVDEKKQLSEEATTELAKLVLKAPIAGKVKIKQGRGTDVKADDVLAEVGEGGTSFGATFDVGTAAAAAKYKANAPCVLAAKSAHDKQAACVVDGVDGTKVSVHLAAGGFAVGEDVTLAPPTP